MIRWIPAALVLAAGAALAAGPAAPSAPPADDEPAVVRTAEAKQAADAGAPAPPEKVTVRFSASVKGARVYWGPKLLGTTPCEITRPRDSGPLDVIVRAGGFLPVHTRGYTFEDNTVFVKLTPTSQANSLYGFKEVIPDDGVAAPSSAPAPTAH